MARPTKAYKNLDFLNSSAARTMRIICEYEEPKARLAAEGVENTIVMFGSARIRPQVVAEQDLAEAKAAADGAAEGSDLAEAVAAATRKLKLSRYYEETRELARRLTEWSLARASKHDYYVCSGGGPGIMEAANRGAADVPGGRSVGFGISLPFEEDLNPYIPDELGFEFHYFFMRKLWFLYLAQCVVICPGGFGTLDEMFETLTLIQTGKVTRRIPMVLYGKEFWDNVLNLEFMVDFGTVSAKDLKLFHKSDTVEDAFEYITKSLIELEEDGAVGSR
jgi:uncharacterized protein (TIGR00730 family)